MILGAPDVIPHQDLINPAFDGVNDADQFAWGDLPYASDKPYSQKPEDFVTVDRSALTCFESGVACLRFFRPKLVVLVCGKFIEAFEQCLGERGASIPIQPEQLRFDLFELSFHDVPVQ
jgi:hypothetical protein